VNLNGEHEILVEKNLPLPLWKEEKAGHRKDGKGGKKAKSCSAREDNWQGVHLIRTYFCKGGMQLEQKARVMWGIGQSVSPERLVHNYHRTYRDVARTVPRERGRGIRFTKQGATKKRGLNGDC